MLAHFPASYNSNRRRLLKCLMEAVSTTSSLDIIIVVIKMVFSFVPFVFLCFHKKTMPFYALNIIYKTKIYNTVLVG